MGRVSAVCFVLRILAPRISVIESLLIEFVRVDQRCIDLPHEVACGGNCLGSEPRFPYLGQALIRHFLLAFPGGNLLSHKRDGLVQKREIFRELAAIRDLTVPGDDHGVVVGSFEHR